MKLPATVFLIIINISLLKAQVVSPSFRHFTTEDGLPSSEVYSVIQDRKGNLWFGTDRGAARYDGYSFRTFTYKDGLMDNTVFKFCEDIKGRLWMLTFSCQLFYYENDSVYAYRNNDKLTAIAENRVPFGFYVDSLENVIVSIVGLGELVINPSGEMKEKFGESNSPDINYVVDELNDKITISSVVSFVIHGGVNILISKEKKLDSFTITGIPDERFNALALDTDAVLISQGKSIYRIKKKSLEQILKLPVNIFILYRDKHENIWEGTEDGAFLLDLKSGKNHNYHYLEGNNVTSILQDNEGGYWFTTLNNGVYYMPGYGIEGIPFNRGLFQKPTSLATDFYSSVYAGCWNGALVKINDGRVKVVYSQPQGNKLLPVMNLSSFKGDEKIYLSRPEPGYFLKGKYIPFKSGRYLGIKTDFFKRSDGEIFSAGTRFIFKNKNDSIITYAVLPQRISCLAETPAHNLLFGSNLGVFELNEADKSSSIFRKEFENIRTDDIAAIGKNIFFATKGKGILVLTNGRVEGIDESRGLASNLVNKLLTDRNELWCCTNKGISHIVFEGSNVSKFSITNIQSNDGLFSDEINDITLLNDTMYAASNYGISFFNINTSFRNNIQPPVYITSVRVNNMAVSLSANSFSHERNNLQISFNGISYRSNRKINYRYVLTSGKDSISSYTTNREVQFLSLSPGDYSFRVAAINNSGIWSTTPAIFSFVIHPAWWQTWWFRIFVILVVIAGIYLFYRSQIRRLRIRFEIERRQASLQLTAMRAQMNPHFIFNVMNSIRNYMLNHDMQSAQKYLTSFSKLVRFVLDNSEVQEVTLEEELSALKNYAELEMQRFENGFEFSIVCEEGIVLSEICLMSMLLQPFVENAIKHGISRMDSGGKIIIGVRNAGATVMISIEDNGIGIEEANKWNKDNRENHTSHGTTINLERIEAYNKVYNKNIRTRIIALTDNEGMPAGTRVEIEI